jgi:bla regulator protein blaR1
MHSFFLQMIGEEIVRALSWTLFHSLWQGLLLALLAGLVVLITKRSKAAIRYNALCGLFFIFLLVSAYTFFSLLDLPGNNTGVHLLLSTGGLSSDQSTSNMVSPTIDSSFRHYFGICLQYVNQHAYLVAGIWFLIFCAKAARLFTNFSYMRRARSFKTSTASLEWQQSIKELALNMGIKRKVDLLLSQWIKTPMVNGFLKPVILFPFTMFSQLPADQVEAVLLHELAHIRRRDYFVNILQSLADIIFFFNPGVLWISSLIRDERENCCDDIAIGHVKNSKPFIYALLAFQEFDLAESGLAPAFPGRKNHLLQRVKRMLNHNNQTLNSMERVFLGGCLLAITLGSVAFSQTTKNKHVQLPATVKLPPSVPNANQAIDPPPAIVPDPSLHSPANVSFPVEPISAVDTVPAKKKGGKFVIDEDGIVIYIRDGYRIETKDDKIIRVFYNDQLMPAEKIPEMEPDLRKIIEAQKIESRKALEMDKEILIRDQKEMLDAQEMQELKMLELQKESSALNDKLQHEKSLEKLQLELSLESAQVDKNLQSDAIKLSVDNAMELSKVQLLKLDQEAKLSKVTYETARGLSLDGIQPLINELMEDKLITNPSECSFELDNSKLIVNKVQMSATWFKKYKARFVKSAKDHYIYRASKGSVHTDINVDD